MVKTDQQYLINLPLLYINYLAGVIAGADGVIIETHQTPEVAFSDGQQTLSHIEGSLLFKQLKQVKVKL